MGNTTPPQIDPSSYPAWLRSMTPSPTDRTRSPPGDSRDSQVSPQFTVPSYRKFIPSPHSFSPKLQSPLARTRMLEYFRRGSSSCPELAQAHLRGEVRYLILQTVESLCRADLMPLQPPAAGEIMDDPPKSLRRPSISQPTTPPRGGRARSRKRRRWLQSSMDISTSPQSHDPPSLAESRERRRRARDSSVASRAGLDRYHREIKASPGTGAESIAMAGVMIAAKELDRLSEKARDARLGKQDA